MCGRGRLDIIIVKNESCNVVSFLANGFYLFQFLVKNFGTSFVHQKLGRRGTLCIVVENWTFQFSSKFFTRTAHIYLGTPKSVGKIFPKVLQVELLLNPCIWVFGTKHNYDAWF